MDNIRVTVLTTSFPLEPQSASGIFIYRLIQQFPANISTTVITPAAQGVVDHVLGEQIDVRTFRYAPRRFELLAHNPGGIAVALKNNSWLYLLIPTFLFSAFINCVRFGARSKIIHANWSINGIIAGLVGKILHTPVITTLRGEDVRRAKKHGLDRWLLRICLVLSTRVVVVSQAMKQWLYSEFPSVKKRVNFIPNGIEDVFLDVHNRRKQSDGILRVLTVGSLIPHKGVDQIIQAMAGADNRENLFLSIVGTGPEAEALRQMVNDLGLARNVRFVGQVAPSDIPSTLVGADIFVLASHSEGRPNVILEAMAAGLPIIASNIDGTNELVKHNETGLLFTDGSIKELSFLLDSLSKDAQRWRELGNNARRFILKEDMSWTRTASRYSELYASLI